MMQVPVPQHLASSVIAVSKAHEAKPDYLLLALQNLKNRLHGLTNQLGNLSRLKQHGRE
jgi:hypothetical protein